METALKKIANYSPAVTREDCENKLQRLKDKGFVNAKNVDELEDQIGRLKYKEKYPNYMFFSDKTFNEIIGRNNLAINPVEHYTGHIPERCVTAILNENVDEKDFRPTVIKFIVKSDLTGYEFKFDYHHFSEDLNKKMDNSYLEKKFIESIKGGISQERVNKLLYGKKTVDGLKYSFTVNYDMTSWDFTKLYIAAPVPAQIRNTPKPDPIVFRYVKDGVLVITFWEE